MEEDLIIAMLEAAEEMIPVKPDAARKLVRGARALYQSGVMEPAAAAPEGPCQHPIAQRKSLATHGNPNAFLCKACDHIEQ